MHCANNIWSGVRKKGSDGSLYGLYQYPLEGGSVHQKQVMQLDTEKVAILSGLSIIFIVQFLHLGTFASKIPTALSCSWLVDSTLQLLSAVNCV